MPELKGWRSGVIVDSYVITYDLGNGDPLPYESFIGEIEKQGLLYVWHGKNLLLRLPNTMVWSCFDRIADAWSAFESVLGRASRCADDDINVQKRATVKAGDFSVKFDVRKAPVTKWTGTSKYETIRLPQRKDPNFSY